MNTRPMSVVHLVFAFFFAGIAILWAMYQLGVLNNVRADWFLPLLLITAGAAGLVAIVLNRSVRREPTAAPMERPMTAPPVASTEEEAPTEEAAPPPSETELTAPISALETSTPDAPETSTNSTEETQR